ncbi:MAG: PHP domain-containing protein [Candidatus Jordarchaeales archaeon]|nr:PHP domain-containing protein [Candidatus Jordarchaeia archaeon]
MSIIDMHVHTEFSPCSRVKLIESLSKAAQLGVGLAITDHDTIKGALKAKSFSQKYEVKIFIGCEVSTKDGQVLAYGIMEEIPPYLPAEQTIELIHEQGAVAVASHPFRNDRESLFEKTYFLPLDGIEVLNLAGGGVSKDAREVAVRRGLAQTGGSDAHTLNLVGEAGTKFPYQPESEEDLIKLIKRKECTPVKFTRR